jgi:hypothetical protein
MFQKKNMAGICLLLTSSGTCYADEAPFSVDVQQQNEVLVRSHGAAPIALSSSEAISLTISGDEEDRCASFGEKSQADGRAGSTVEVTSEGVSARLLSSSTAISGRCAGFFGGKTEGKAESSASITTEIKFNPNYPVTNYLIDIPQPPKNGASKLKIIDSQGNEVTPIITENGKGLITAGPGSEIQFIAEIKTAANTQGECCSEPSEITSDIGFEIRKAPIIASEYLLQGYVWGGEPTDNHGYVGAITLNGMLHCTGTLVGKKTILTAAHCLEGYESQIGELQFVFGPSVNEPMYPPIKVTSFDYPKGEPKGYKFDRNTLEDDIGVLYLEKEPPNIPPSNLHSGIPSWSQILNKKYYLTFVGYGYDVVNNKKIGPGVKREASWRISNVESRRVSFIDPNKGTCSGDSGGPAFLPYGDQILQVAITSGGPRNCTRGIETRVDAFKTWINGKII